MRSYREFKLDLKPEIYLKVVDSKKFKIALSRLRCSAHKLDIEMGRIKNIDSVLRLCKLCEKVGVDDVEDEYHFVMTCTFLIEIRETYIKRYYWSNPTVHKFIELMKSDCPNVLNGLAIYVYLALKYRILKQSELQIYHNIWQ